MVSEKNIFDYSIPQTLRIKLEGNWQLSADLISVNEVTLQLANHPDIRQINFTVLADLKWDSGLVSFLFKLIKECKLKKINIATQDLPQEVQKILTLAFKVPEKNISPQKEPLSLLEKFGEKFLQLSENVYVGIEFLGEIAISLGRLITGKAYFRRDDFMLNVQKCGVDTFLLVSLISLLVGMILAFVGSIQLKMFGAQIFVSDIVGIAMVRLLSALMTGIIMSGRIGASFAAELAMMQTNEEIDALKTLGVSAVEFLVIPRFLALIIMVPLLTIYADFMGILGGFIISTKMLSLNPVEYYNHTIQAVKLSYVWVGLIHSFVFAIIIAIAGCLHGINCQRSAAGVGIATTSAVVTGITGIVIATAIITFIFQILGI